MDPISAVSTGTQLLTTIAGLFGSAKENKKYQKEQSNLLNTRKQDITSLFNNEYSRDFLDTEVAKSAMKGITENYNRGVQTNDLNVAKGGGTVEAQNASREAQNASYNDAVSKLTSYGTQYRDNLRRDFQNQLGQLFNVEMGNLNQQHAQKQASWGNLMGNAAGIGDGIAGLFAKGE